MIRKTLFGILFVCTAILFLSAFVSSVSASTLYVPDDYTTIQAAVDAAGPGDVIVVRDGTYKENVNVNKPRLTIKSENGADKTTVEAVTSSYDDIVFEVTEDYVNIIGFTVKAGDYGIYLNIVHHCNIQNNNISAGYGIYLSASSNNNIIKNTVSNCPFGITLSGSFSNNINNNILLNNPRGIYLGGSKNIVSNNTVSYSGAEGIYLSDSKSNSISNNTVSHNGKGIRLDGESEKNNITNNVVLHNGNGIEYCSRYPNNICNNIVSSNSYGIYILSRGHVSNNIVSDNTYGIYLSGSLNMASWKNTITSNNVSNNTYGIYLNSACIKNTITNNNVSNSDEGILLSDEDSSENIISGNNVLSNTYGIRLFGSESNNITRNTANWNTYYGIYLSEGSSENIITQNTASNNYNGIYITESSDNICYLNNFANKADNVYSYKSTNTWNSTEKKTYIYKGLTYVNYMGNYWSDYTGSDTDNNGIGDTSYSIDSDKDNYPLMVPWEIYFAPPENHPPTAIRMEPEFKEVSINFGDAITFRVKAEDEDAEVHNNLHMVQWFVDDIWMETDPANGTSEEANFTYTFENERTFTVNATVYDEQMEEASVIWKVNVGVTGEFAIKVVDVTGETVEGASVMLCKYKTAEYPGTEILVTNSGETDSEGFYFPPHDKIKACDLLVVKKNDWFNSENLQNAGEIPKVIKLPLVYEMLAEDLIAVDDLDYKLYVWRNVDPLNPKRNRFFAEVHRRGGVDLKSGFFGFTKDESVYVEHDTKLIWFSYWSLDDRFVGTPDTELPVRATYDLVVLQIPSSTTIDEKKILQDGADRLIGLIPRVAMLYAFYKLISETFWWEEEVVYYGEYDSGIDMDENKYDTTFEAWKASGSLDDHLQTVVYEETMEFPEAGEYRVVPFIQFTPEILPPKTCIWAKEIRIFVFEK